jgi:predicted ribosome quality control (RQC) complex YloA/Tae2 family protein
MTHILERCETLSSGVAVLEEFKLVPDESILFDLTPDEVTLLFYVAALSISPSLTIDELNVLANGLFLMAQVMFTITSQRTLLNDAIKAEKEKDEQAKDDKKSVEKLESEIKKIQDQIENIQKQIKELKK